MSRYSFSTLAVNPIGFDHIVGNPTRADARKAIQKMWVAGTLGVFFTTVLRNVPVHVRQASLTPDWPYTLDLFTRYGYLLWLLVYFFMSNFRIDQSDDRNDLRFDVIQSVASLTALVSLDFVVSGYGIPVGHYAWAITVANVTILIIASLALKWFKVANLKSLRVAGLILAALSIAVAWIPAPPVPILLAVAALEVGLLAVLFVYVSRRWPAK